MIPNSYRSNTTRVHVRVTRTIGQDNITLSSSTRCEKGDEALEYGRLFGEMDAAMHHYINEFAANAPSNPVQPSVNGNQLNVDVTGFNVRSEKGMKIVKCLCTEYPEHGIIVYDEILETIGLTKADIPLEGWKFKEPLKGTILFKDGKPLKVIKLKGIVQL